jgi:hypothetical protein
MNYMQGALSKEAVLSLSFKKSECNCCLLIIIVGIYLGGRWGEISLTRSSKVTSPNSICFTLDSSF